MMLDDVLVERIGGKLLARRRQLALVPRNEPQQIALPAAVGTVALHCLGQVTLDRELDAAAMAGAFVLHDVASRIVDTAEVPIVNAICRDSVPQEPLEATEDKSA